MLPLWELSARGEGGHSLQPPARPHDHHDFKYKLSFLGPEGPENLALNCKSGWRLRLDAIVRWSTSADLGGQTTDHYQ